MGTDELKRGFRERKQVWGKVRTMGKHCFKEASREEKSHQRGTWRIRSNMEAREVKGPKKE